MKAGSPDQHRAAAAYASASALAQSPQDVIARVHSAILSELHAAKNAYERNKLDQMFRHTEKAARILGALIVSLDFERGGAPGLTLRGLYMRLRNDVVGVLRDANVSARLQRGIESLQALTQTQELSGK